MKASELAALLRAYVDANGDADMYIRERGSVAARPASGMSPAEVTPSGRRILIVEAE